MLVVGLTGGIGSGKSAAAEHFRHHNVVIINSDEVSREVVEPGGQALDQIVQRFSSDVLQNDGSLNRAALRRHIFDNAEERQWLENLLHPLIRKRSDQQLRQPQQPGEPPYRILEIPLLFETNSQDRVDRTLLITADRDCRIQRVVERDNSDREQVLAILDAQLPDAQKTAMSDDCIDNSHSLDALHREVDTMHRFYCELGAAD